MQRSSLIMYLLLLIAIISLYSFVTKVLVSNRITTSTSVNSTKAVKITTELNKPKEAEEISASIKTLEHIKTTYPYVITTNRYTYLIFLKDKDMMAIRDGKVIKKGKRYKRRIYNSIRRSGLKNCVCHKIRGRRFLCIFRNGKYREVSLKLLCELLIVAEKRQDTFYPEGIRNFITTWQNAWMHITDNFTGYASLYHQDFKNRYGDINAWLAYRKANLNKIKYIDLLIDDPVYTVMPPYEKGVYAVFFNQIYRSNIKRVEGLKGLLIKEEGNSLKILTETGI